MRLVTKNFGEIEISEKEIIEFESPVLGFEDKKRYVFVKDESLDGRFVWLQSVDDGALCFVMASPSNLPRKYSPSFTENIEELIGKGSYSIWLIMVVAEDFSESTVNMKSPVLVNSCTGKGAQLISEEKYSFNYKLFKEGE